MIPRKHLLSHPRDNFSRLHMYLRLLVHPQGTSPSRSVQGQWRGTVSHPAGALDHSLSLPPEVDLSSITDPGTPPEYLVVAVWNLRPSLPIDCGLFGRDDLSVVGSYPIDAGGFADVWLGKMNDGTMVAIKSYRYYSSSSCLPIYMVSKKCYHVFRLLTITQSGCTRKRWCAVASATATRVSCHFWGFTQPRNTRFPSFSSSWITRTSGDIWGKTNVSRGRNWYVFIVRFVSSHHLITEILVAGNSSWSKVHAWPWHCSWERQNCTSHSRGAAVFIMHSFFSRLTFSWTATATFASRA